MTQNEKANEVGNGHISTERGVLKRSDVSIHDHVPVFRDNNHKHGDKRVANCIEVFSRPMHLGETNFFKSALDVFFACY